MRKITLLLFALLLSVTAFAQLPVETFEGTWPPTGWTINNVTGPAQTWVQGNGGDNQPGYQSTHAAYLNKENVANGTFAEDWLITPQILIPSSPQLHFFSRLTQLGDQGSVYKVYIGTDPTNLTTFTELQSWTESEINPVQTEYVEKILDIPAAHIGQQRYIAFVMLNDDGDRWLVDNVSLVTQCVVPTNLTATNITANSASLNWTDAAGAGAWEIQVIEATATPGTTGTAYSGTLPYQATNLNPSTSYVYYVRSACLPAGNNSAWAGPFSFSTTQVPADLNFSTTFETANNGFTIINGTQTNKWVIGTATSNSPAYSLYVSNDNGVTNAYTNSTSSVVHAYRDINIPAGATEMNLSFDWKNVGETGWDYIRVWNTPTTYTPVAGTQTATGTGRVQIGGNFVGNSAWTTSSNTIDVTAYAGTTRRFVFEWRNDSGGGSNPPGAIDNVSFTLITCSQPTTLTATNPTQNSATLGWTNVGSATSWEVYVVPAGTAAPTASTTGTIVTTNPYTVNDLTPGTNYVFYVRAVCGPDDKSLWSGPLNFGTTQVPATLNYTNDFETLNGFSFVNGTQPNQWFYGTAVSNSPTHSLYITNNNGVGNTYTTNASSIVHAYRDIAIPAATGDINLSFDWRNLGETGWDYIRVWLVPVTYIPAAGTQTAAAAGRIQIGGDFVGSSTWTNYSNTFNASAYAGTTMRLVFEWRNDSGGGSNPPGAIDNVNITSISCSQPSALAVSNLTATSATLGWTEGGSATSWEVYVVPAADPAPTASSAGVVVTTNPYTVNDLTAGTNYKYYVRAVCGPDDVSFWSGPFNFSTTQVPATLDYSNNFETTNGFTLVNGTQTNQWFYGTAVSNSPTHSLYVTNDAGVTNAYTTSTTSVVHAYRDFAIPTGTTDVNFSFDWRNLGETGWDYIRVWAVPVTYTPAAGTQTSVANSGGVQLGANFVGNATWTNYNQIFNASAYAGQTMRLVFEWRNDGGGGTNPPGAVDNVNLSVITCPQPTNIAVTNVTQTEATIGWTNIGTAASWEVYVVPSTEPAPTASSEETVVTTNPYTVSDLVPGLNYNVYVRAVCGADDVSLWTGPVNFSTLQIPATLNYSNDFETTNGFTLVNGTQTNQWFYGTAVSNSPTHSLYVTNDGGVTNAYTTSSTSVAHAYRDFAIPAGTSDINVAFDWRNLGETTFDYIRVWAVPVTYNPVAGTQTTTANSAGVQLGGNFSANANWTTYNQVFNASAYAGTTMRLVFEWRNDSGGGSNPPGAIDNVNLTIITCPQPTAVTVTNMTQTEATINWTEAGTATSWEVYVVPNGDPAPTAATAGTVVTTNPYTVTDLTAGTLYQVYVRAICSETDKSFWTGPTSFSTTICDPTDQCNYSFIVSDSFGDGWNGNTMTVTQNGITVATLTLTSGTGPQTILVPLCDNVPFTLFWNSGGSFANEVGVAIQDPFGDDLYTKAPGSGSQNTTLYSGVAGCTPPPCPKPTDLVINCLTSEGVTFSWTDPGDVSEWEVVLQPAADPLPENGTVVTVPTYTATNLVSGTQYTFYVRTVCPDGSGFSTWTSINFTAPVVSVGEAQALCSGILAVPQPSNYGNTIPPYGAVGCLGSTPNPTWYYVTLGGDGEVVLNLNQVNMSGTGIDVDFAAFGPFNSLLEACSSIGNPLNTDYIVDCSYSAAATETINLDGQEGDIFALLVTNFNGAQGNTTITQTSGPDISCVPTVELGQDQVLCSTDSYNITATVNNPGATQVYTYQWFMDADPITPTVVSTTDNTQTVTVTEPGSHVYSVIVTMPNPVNDDPVTDQVTIALSPAFTPPVQSPITLCGDNGTAEIDLSTIDFLGTLDPENYELVGIYTSQSNANTNTDPITASPYVATTQTLYAVIRDINVPTCKQIVPLSITVSNAASAIIAYTPSVFCNDDATVALPTQSGSIGGVYSATPAGLSIDAATGGITPSESTAGTYQVIYTVAATATCPEFISEPVTIEIIAAPEATFSYANPAYCSGAGTATITFEGTTGGTFSAAEGLSIDPVTGEVDLAASTVGTYDVYYDVAAAGACAAQQFGPATITITTLHVADIAYAGTPYCSNAGIATATNNSTDLSGTYSATPAGLAINASTGAIDLASSTPGTYQVVYTIAAAGGCDEVISAPVEVVVTQLPLADFQYEFTSYCTNFGTINPVFVGGGVAGTFTADAPGLVIDSATGVINAETSTPGTYIVTNTIAPANGCTPVPVTVSITITPAPIADFTYSAPAYCQDGDDIPTPALAGDSGVFSAEPAGLAIDSATGIIDLDASTPGIYMVYNTINGTTECPTVVSAPVEVAIVSLPVISVTQGCDGTQYTLQAVFDNDPVYSADDVTVTWYLGSTSSTALGTGETQVISGGGTYYAVVVPNAGNACPATQEVVVDDTICEIPRGISPNADGMNDDFDLTGYGVTKLSIFNRYGQEVFNFNGSYTNEFHGTASNGDELPTGTYFYMIRRTNGEAKTGWVYINRED